METRECPMCGGVLRIKQTEIATPVPGNPKPTIRILREWVCPDCDYFEDADEGTK